MFLDTIDATLAMSVLTYAEVLVHPTRAGKVAEFEQNIDDQLVGLEIFASQRKIDEFTELYNKIVPDTTVTASTT
jgi:hypothetical protein